MDNQENNNEVYEISLKSILKIVRQGLWIIAVTAVVFAVAAFGFSKFFIQKTYTSSVKLYVETTKNNNDNSYYALSSYNYATSLVNTYIEMLETNNFFEKLSKNMDEKYTAAQLSSMVKFSNNTSVETEVFKATITADSPTESKVIADSVADVAPEIISSLSYDAELKIVDNAVVPIAPSSPNVMKNTFIAFAAGLVLALIFVFVREALDNKIKYDPDMTELNSFPILAAIPDFSDADINVADYLAPSLEKEQSSDSKKEGK